MNESSPPRTWQHHRLDSWTALLLIGIAAVMVVCIGRVVQLKLTPDQRLAGAAGSPFSTRVEPARRGDLLDRRGRVIATTTLGHRAFVDPATVEDLATIGVDLQELIGLDPVEVDRRVAPRHGSRFVPISGILEPWQVERIRRSGLDGVGLEPRLVRHYPQQDTGAQLIGLVGFEHTGLGGAEHLLDEDLAGSEGRMTYLRDVRRRPLWISPETFRPHEDGTDCRLTIDMVIQRHVEERLEAEIVARNAAGGRVVVLDPATGELLAIADLVNPDRTPREGDPAPETAPPDPRLARNRCATDPYEPGSTFKPFVWAFATQQGVVTPSEILATPDGTPHRTRSGRRIRDVHYYGRSSWEKVLVKSMNSGMAIVAERLDTDSMQSCISRFGFGTRTNCGLPGETAGLVTSSRDWSSYTQVSVSMGHEIGVTPLQMVRAFSVFATDGNLPALHLLAHGGHDPSPRVQHRILDPGIARLTRLTMRKVMTDGTGRACQSEWYQLFGKSGTAQLPKAAGGGYHEDRYISSFIAGAPLESPRLVVLCVIEDPDKRIGPYYGGRVAGPVVRDVLDHALAYLGVTPDLDEVEGFPDLLAEHRTADP
ncbi:MAG: penicillin-binding protein 2 [Planctomycetota bacterium]|nr:penicillin-binding protein 2 [Planctomycetota bacterium]